MARPKEYRKLPGRGTRLEGTRWIAAFRKGCRLWLAADHILLILSTRFSQEFKRFYFRDIQAITIRKTNSARTASIVLGIFAVIFAAIGFAVNNTVGRGILWIIAGFFTLLTLINAARGPSCITEIKTAAQTEELSSLKRLHTAQKTLAILRPLIEDAQGKIAHEDILPPSPPPINIAPQESP